MRAINVLEASKKPVEELAKNGEKPARRTGIYSLNLKARLCSIQEWIANT
jgi:hypothetical protein